MYGHSCTVASLHLKVHNANANFSLVQFPCYHFIIGLVSTFKHDDVSVPKTFMPAHSCMMTFLHLKYIMADANFPLIQFSLSLHLRFGFNI